jgi:acyl carrier protein
VIDLEMDDLEPVELLMALESDLAITIPEEEADRLQTVAGLIEYLHERVESHAPAAAETAKLIG